MAGYIRYILNNIEPIRIADDSSSQSGQTSTLKHIPGTTIRGLIINKLATAADFEAKKKLLFSDKVRFLNAYPMVGDKELIPSPKGFYENKDIVVGKKKIENVVIDGAFSEGYKRASIGRFVDIDSDTITYYNIETGSDMKIKIVIRDEDDKQNVFRNEFINQGYTFAGYISVDDESLVDDIKKVLNDIVVIGNGRTAGLGKCKVLSCEYVENQLPYENYLPTDELFGECYMMLLSPTVMRDDKGEFCGINLPKLQKLMGVEDLKICQSSTSTVEVKGYNRAWGVKTPSVVMFDMGSVFHLSYKGTLSKEKMVEICDQGIGVRGNEGFGRVIFLKDYDKVEYKIAGELCKANSLTDVAQLPEDKEVLRLVAKNYYMNYLNEKINIYVVDNAIPKGALKASQLGVLMSFTTAYQYDPVTGCDKIKAYFEHAQEKESSRKIFKVRDSVLNLKSFVETLFEGDLRELLGVEMKESIMGIPYSEILTEEEKKRLKLSLLTRLIKYDNKEGN